MGVKSIAAYRSGLDLRPERPPDSEVAAAAGRWLAPAGPGRPGWRMRPCSGSSSGPAWTSGCRCSSTSAYGDTDVDLHRGNPLLLHAVLLATQPTGTPVMLLHYYPYHRQAGYLAHVFPHVYIDAGRGHCTTSARAPPALLAEALELAPFGKFLYSSDAFGLPELHYLGATLFRSALSAFLRTGLNEDLYSERTVVRLSRMLCADNAKRAYQLGCQM